MKVPCALSVQFSLALMLMRPRKALNPLARRIRGSNRPDSVVRYHARWVGNGTLSTSERNIRRRPVFVNINSLVTFALALMNYVKRSLGGRGSNTDLSRVEENIGAISGPWRTAAAGHCPGIVASQKGCGVSGATYAESSDRNRACVQIGGTASSKVAQRRRSLSYLRPCIVTSLLCDGSGASEN